MFGERCIEAYKKAEKEREEIARRKTEEFRDRAIRIFEKLFDTKVTDSDAISEHEVRLWIDDVRIVARSTCTDVQFFVMKQCQHCGSYFLPEHPNSCKTIKDIGADLVEPSVCSGCKLAMDVVKTKTPEEKIVEKSIEIFEILKKWNSGEEE